MGLDRAQEDMQDGAERPRLALQEIRSRSGTESTHWRTGSLGKT